MLFLWRRWHLRWPRGRTIWVIIPEQRKHSGAYIPVLFTYGIPLYSLVLLCAHYISPFGPVPFTRSALVARPPIWNRSCIHFESSLLWGPQDGKGYVGGLAYGMRSDKPILKEFGPRLKRPQERGGDPTRWQFPEKKAWYDPIFKEHTLPNMASQVQRWALLHLGPWRASISPVVHVGCVPQPLRWTGMWVFCNSTRCMCKDHCRLVR